MTVIVIVFFKRLCNWERGNDSDSLFSYIALEEKVRYCRKSLNAGHPVHADEILRHGHKFRKSKRNVVRSGGSTKFDLEVDVRAKHRAT